MNQEQFEEDKLIPKWKVALIPILGVSLVIVLIPKADAKQNVSTPATSLSLKPTSSEKDHAKANLAELPSGSLSSASQFNPFKMGEPLLRLTLGNPKETGPTAEEVAAQIKQEKEAEQRRLQKIAMKEKIKSMNVSLIVQTEEGVAAIVDSQIVHVGDEIQPGVFVSHIGNDGLKISFKESENRQIGENVENTAPVLP